VLPNSAKGLPGAVQRGKRYRLAIVRRRAYLVGRADLESLPSADFPASRDETAEEKAQRLAREAEMIAQARASVAAGRVVSLEAVTAWVDSWDTDNELPPPHLGL
jgi:hypothetical protein